MRELRVARQLLASATPQHSWTTDIAQYLNAGLRTGGYIYGRAAWPTWTFAEEARDDLERQVGLLQDSQPSVQLPTGSSRSACTRPIPMMQHRRTRACTRLPRCVSLLLLALALASSASAQAPAPAASSSSSPAATKWTILVYMLADNDLDCAGMVNLEVGHSRGFTCSSCRTSQLVRWSGMLHIPIQLTALPSLHHINMQERPTHLQAPHLPSSTTSPACSAPGPPSGHPRSLLLPAPRRAANVPGLPG